MLFEGINRIYRDYGVFDYPRSDGSRHNGMDIDGVNSFVIRMPSFNGKTISGTVTRSRIVTDHSDSTWEWGYYVTVKLSTPQTVDGTAIHYLTFAHNARNLVSDGDTVTTGTPLAIAGKTGNAEGEQICCGTGKKSSLTMHPLCSMTSVRRTSKKNLPKNGKRKRRMPRKSVS